MGYNEHFYQYDNLYPINFGVSLLLNQNFIEKENGEIAINSFFE